MFMSDHLAVGLAAWIVQDGNYDDFCRGDHAAFALEFYPRRGLELLEPGEVHSRSLTPVGNGCYEAVGRVAFLADDWWAVDFGVLAFAEETPPKHARLGLWVRGDMGLGVDPFFYFGRLCRRAGAPALIYDWSIEKIEVQTAPIIEVRAGWRERDPARLGWKEVCKTDAWNDDGGSAEYLLHCKRHNDFARRALHP